MLAGSDGLLTPRSRLIHVLDTLVVVDPATLPARLHPAGLVEADVTTHGDRLRFFARCPPAQLA